jgi:uncharacterized protein (TIGR03437 family)
VDVDGVPAFMTLVTPGQLNFQVPAVHTNTNVNVQVRTNCGAANESRGAAVPVWSQNASPELLYWAQNADGNDPVMALNAITGAYVGPTGARPGLLLTPAKPGDILTIYGISFGPTNPAIAPGAAAAGVAPTVDTPAIRFGTGPMNAADILYLGISPGSPGLYQLNIRVPAGLADGNYPLVVNLGIFDTPVGGYLAVKN